MLMLFVKGIHKMDNNPSPVHNMFANLTRKQIAGIGSFIMIIIIVLILIALIVNTMQQSPNSNNEPETTDAIVSEAVKWGDIDSDTNTHTDSNSTDTIKVPVSTEYNEKHEYTLADYIPYDSYVFLDKYDSNDTLRIYYSIDENSAIEKGIVISVDSCDVEGNTIAAQNYLKSIPVDLSEYVVVYQTHSGNVPCDIK